MLLRPVLMPILRNPLQGIADGIRNMLAELLGSSQFFAPLTHSLVLARGTGSTTFTRADATNCATFRDWEGWLRTVPSGCARFEGARMVQNLWTTSSATLANGANKSLTLATGDYTFSMGAGTGTATFSGTGGATGTLAASASGRVEVTKTITAGTFVVTASVADLVDLQVEYVTGQADQTASEYVSVGVPSDWAGIDLVTNGDFSGGAAGWTAGAGVSIGSGVASFDGTNNATLSQAAVFTNGQNYVVSFTVPSGGGAIRAYLGSGIAGTLTTVTGGTYSFAGTASGDGVLYLQSNGTSFIGTVDNISVKPAVYHGAGVDGVEFFNTDRDGAVIPAATNTGYLAEGARTNLCLQSNAFTTAPWGNDLDVISQNAIGPDGATSAWTATDSSAVAARFFQAGAMTLTAAPWTTSIFVKKTSGATSFPVSYMVTGSSVATITIDTNNGVATPWTAYTGLTIVPCTAVVTSFNADYWRVAFTFTATAVAWAFTVYVAATTNATQSTGALDVTAQGSAVFYGAQVELGSFASSYIATTTVAVTRAADVDSVPTASNILAAASTVCLEFTPDHTPSGTIALWGTYVDASNYTAILHDATNMIMRKRIAGVNYDATIANAFTANTTYKVCGSWGASGVTVTLDGTEGTANANTTAAQIAATMQWGADGNSLQQPFATERNARVWQRQLSTSERGAITA